MRGSQTNVCVLVQEQTEKIKHFAQLLQSDLTFAPGNGIIFPHGELSERFKELVLKTSDGETHREFESHTLRQKETTIFDRRLSFLFVLFTFLFSFFSLPSNCRFRIKDKREEIKEKVALLRKALIE